MAGPQLRASTHRSRGMTGHLAVRFGLSALLAAALSERFAKSLERERLAARPREVAVREARRLGPAAFRRGEALAAR